MCNNEFKFWLRPVKNNAYKSCILCNIEFTAELTVIKNHKESVKHKERVKDKDSIKKSAVDKFFNIDSPLELQTKEAEIKICAFLSAHNTSFL